MQRLSLKRVLAQSVLAQRRLILMLVIPEVAYPTFQGDQAVCAAAYEQNKQYIRTIHSVLRRNSRKNVRM